MMCKNCNFSTQEIKHRCWKKWQLCGNCAVKIHPKEYDLGKRILKTVTKKTYRKCECGEVLVRIGYQKYHKYHSLNNYYCVKCKLIS